jgi:hypothetical protein
MNCCRGPLPDGHPCSGVIYFSPDQDLAPGAANLAKHPPIEPFRYVEGPAVLLDAHRAPDEWFAAAVSMPQLTVQGDPDSYRPRGRDRFAAELETQTCYRPCAVALATAPTLTQGIQLARGRSMVLVGSRVTRDALWQHLRPMGLIPGDPVMDLYGRSGIVESIRTGHVFTDGGRRSTELSRVTQHLIVSPSGVRAAEYDTVVVMPDVPEKVARTVCHRTRYLIVGVAHSPLAYAH